MLDLSPLKISDSYWYLATPYAKYHEGINAAFEAASRVAARLIADDVAVFCPIAHAHPISAYGNLSYTSHELWLPLDKRMMHGAHGLIVVRMPGWDESVGVRWEIEEFSKAYKPIMHLSWPELELVNDLA